MQKEHLKKFKLPDAPGVYLFKRGRKILYIGKAASLRDRVRSYFNVDLAESRSPAIAGMIAKTHSIAWKKTDSVLEALILEANLIKKHQPRYNIDQKDNKSWNHVVITKEDFPRVLIVRGRELFGLKADSWKPKAIFGPYPHGGALREAVRLVRKIFPFRDSKCVPCMERLHISGLRNSRYRELRSPDMKCRPCFNRQIGLCPGVCTGEISKEEYRGVIRSITELFSGGMRSLKRRLEREMKAVAKQENFERAAELRRQVHALEHIRDISLIKEEHRVSTGGSFRIEAYDVAHTSGTETVGVMTVVAGGQAEKSEYRMFKVRGVRNDDPGALKEILERRLAHTEWQLPRLIVVDGGSTQLRAAEKVLAKAGVSIPIVGVVKDEFHRPEHIIGDSHLTLAYEKDILLANHEAHRFAITSHRRRLRKAALVREIA